MRTYKKLYVTQEFLLQINTTLIILLWLIDFVLLVKNF